MPLAVKNPRDGYYSMGDHTYKVPMALFAENRARLAAALRETPGLPDRYYSLSFMFMDQFRL